MRSFLIIFIYASLGSLGLSLLKKGLNNTVLSLASIKSPILLAGFVLYGFSFILWIKILNENELSYAFPIASATLFIFISMLSWYFLHEHLSITKITGMILIIIGIFIVSRG